MAVQQPIEPSLRVRATVAPQRTEDRQPRQEWVAAGPATADVVLFPDAPAISFDTWGGSIDGPVPRPRAERLSRALNVASAAVTMVLIWPILLVIAIAIRLTSPGPIVYTQTRIGLDRRWNRASAVDERRREDLGGKVFTIYKFRTMEVDAERDSGAVYAQKDDPRVHRIGRLMRTFRLDELPQLWNVLRGDMNIVGPRPERPSIVAILRGEMPEYQFRHRVRPGITGLAQINQDYQESVSDVRGKVHWDLEYITRQGIGLDLKIMLLTIPTVLLRFRGR